jgi:Response regulators consisting of a CheY-like receiver domain and a winged-helix DNA-binding domain
MSTHKKSSFSPWLKALPFVGFVLIIAIQCIWLSSDYQQTYRQFMTEIYDAFSQALQKEQTYRIPVGNIVNPGDLTIQSCGEEEIRIIRKCPMPDTIVYDNLSSQSLETFINRAFFELREHILPLNIHCLSDLFSGALYEKNISITFDLERFATVSGEILETTAIAKNSQTLSPKDVVEAEMSGTESLRANLYFSPLTIFGRMNRMLISTTCLLLLALIFFYIYWHFTNKQKTVTAPVTPVILQEEIKMITEKQENVFQIGSFRFDFDKNELQGSTETTQLNKKENEILYELCVNDGNVVERNFLLEKYWGDNGFIYSRSLDTYIANIRKHLKEDDSVQIVTIKSLGYKLVSNAN